MSSLLIKVCKQLLEFKRVILCKVKKSAVVARQLQAFTSLQLKQKRRWSGCLKRTSGEKALRVYFISCEARGTDIHHVFAEARIYMLRQFCTHMRQADTLECSARGDRSDAFQRFSRRMAERLVVGGSCGLGGISRATF